MIGGEDGSVAALEQYLKDEGFDPNDEVVVDNDYAGETEAAVARMIEARNG